MLTQLILSCRYASEQIQSLNSSNSVTPSSRKAKWTPVTLIEMKAFIALVINMGLIDIHRLEDYWRTSMESFMPFFSRVVSKPFPKYPFLLARKPCTIKCHCQKNRQDKNVYRPLISEIFSTLSTIRKSQY